MRASLFLILLLLLLSPILQAQGPIPYGNPTPDELALDTYEKDSTASAVVLYEWGNNYFIVEGSRAQLVKEYHVKIKILDNKGSDYGTVEIPLYHNGSTKERIVSIRAVTHQNGQKFPVNKDDYHTVDLSERWEATKFAFPKVQEGSILEYKYTLHSPYLFNLNGWEFQWDIPKIYSEFNAKIPGNWVYNRALIGTLKLATNDSSLERNCFRVDGITQPADCEVLRYAMKDVPAFKEEPFMLAEKNYISRLDFELAEYHSVRGETTKYTQSWDDVDREFRGDKDIGRQLTKKGFFERNVPDSLFLVDDPEKRAQGIYAFVQNHYNWNGEYSTYGKARVKEAFDAQKGNAWEINMSLINLLRAADIPANLMLLSTRQHGLPKQVHPIISDFNYIVAHVTLNGKEVLLDATQKGLPFGMLPYRALNHYGRVMDFKESSYWHNIIPTESNGYVCKSLMLFDPESNKVTGKITFSLLGYESLGPIESNIANTGAAYLDKIQGNKNGHVEMVNSQIRKENTPNQSLTYNYEYDFAEDYSSGTLYVNPFLLPILEKNPFLSEKRQYPIALGYPKKVRMQSMIQIPKGYYLEEKPEDIKLTLADGSTMVRLKTTVSNDQIIVHYDFNLGDSNYTVEAYTSLREMFQKAVDIQKNSLLVLKKKSTTP